MPGSRLVAILKLQGKPAPLLSASRCSRHAVPSASMRAGGYSHFAFLNCQYRNPPSAAIVASASG